MVEGPAIRTAAPASSEVPEAVAPPRWLADFEIIEDADMAGSQAEGASGVDDDPAAPPRQMRTAPPREAALRRLSDGVRNNTNVTTDFKVVLGEIVIAGPYPDHALTCVQGMPCAVDIAGVELEDGDRALLARINASAPTAAKGCEGMEYYISERALRGGTRYSFGMTRFAAPIGDYTVCWCRPPKPGASYSAPWFKCDDPADFNIVLGQLTVGGPTPNQVKSCVIGQRCSISLEGTELSAGDQLMILDTCGIGYGVNGMPNNGVSGPADNRGQVNWGAGIVTSSGGKYRMCWCRGTSAFADLPELLGWLLHCLQPLNERQALERFAVGILWNIISIRKRRI